MIQHIRVGISVSLAVFTPASFADNLISNPDFTHGLLDWAFVSDEWIGTMESDFEHGSPAPPSAHVHGGTDNPNSAIASTCIAIDGTSKIDFSFEALVVAGIATGDVIAYGDDTCSNSLGSLETRFIEPAADWQTIVSGDAALPPGTRAVQFAFYARALEAGTIADAYVDHIAVGPAGTLPAAIPIDQPGLTGAWYDPAKSGQGLQFTIDPTTGTLFGAWYTYDTEAGGTDTQRWYSLQASLESADVSADITIYRNTDGYFDAPPATTATPVGTATLAFDSCTSGTLAYTLDDGREGSIRVQSLHPQGNCDETGHLVIDAGPVGLSGTWYDPAIPGQGVMINIDTFGQSVFVGWYTYATGSVTGVESQRWFSAQGSYGDGSPVQLTVYQSTGGTFDSPNPVTTREVGSATLNFASCEHATLAYTFTAGDLTGRSGSIPLTRLEATPEGCQLTN